MTATSRSVVMVGELPEPFGGVALHCYHTCQELARLGVEVHVLDSAPGATKHLPPLAGYTRLTKRYVRGGFTALRSPRLIGSWIALVAPVARQIGPRAALQSLVLSHRTYAAARLAGTQTIIAHHAGERGLAALVAARALDARVTLVIHGSEWSHPTWNRGLADIVATRAHRIIANSSYTRQLCTEATERDDISILSPGVDHDRFLPTDRTSERVGDPIVLFIGAMHPRKGADVLARAVSLLDDVPARFIFAGPSGPLEQTVRSLVSGYSRERVEFRGQLRSDEVPTLLAEADIFVFPTVWGTEGFGMVAAEAMACGVPVVASRIAAIPEVVLDGETGLLTEPGDPLDLASKLRLLLQDPGQRRRLGRAGTKHALQYRWDRLAQGLIEDSGSEEIAPPRGVPA